MLPDEIGELKKLKRLDVRMETGHWTSVITSWLQFVWWDCWSEVTNVIGDRAVYLSSRGLWIVPEAVSDLTELEELDLPDNYLEELPTSINKLKNLKRLTSEVNQLRELPQAIAELSNLTVLSSSVTTSCLFYLQTLKNPRRLYLSSNQLTALPDEIGELKELEWLNERLETTQVNMITCWLHCLMRMVNSRSWNDWMWE